MWGEGFGWRKIVYWVYSTLYYNFMTTQLLYQLLHIYKIYKIYTLKH